MSLALGQTIKDVAAAVGVIVPLGGIYAVSGLPIPATVSQVESRIAPVRQGLIELQVVVLQQQKAIVQNRRTFLRSDRYSISIQPPSKDPNLILLNQRRLGQIDDELAELNRQDENLSKRIEELSARPWQDQTTKKNSSVDEQKRTSNSSLSWYTRTASWGASIGTSSLGGTERMLNLIS